MGAVDGECRKRRIFRVTGNQRSKNVENCSEIIEAFQLKEMLAVIPCFVDPLRQSNSEVARSLSRKLFKSLPYPI